MGGVVMGAIIHPRNTLYVDIDGTLIDHNGDANATLIAWLRVRKIEGWTIHAWSAGGVDHVVDVLNRHHLNDLFSARLCKPTEIVDDDGWGWAKFVRARKPK